MAQLIENDEALFTAFEPLLKMRYIMQIDGIPSYVIRRVDRPKMDSAEVEIPHINTVFYVKGKSKWQTATLELMEPIVPSAAQSVMEWVRLSHESVTGRDGYASMYQKDITIQCLGPVGDIVQEWTYKSAWIKTVEFSDMDMTSEADVTSITLTIRYNYGVLAF